MNTLKKNTSLLTSIQIFLLGIFFFLSLHSFANEPLSWSEGWYKRAELLQEKGLDPSGQRILAVGAFLTVAAIPFDDKLENEIKVSTELSGFGSKLGGGVPSGVVALTQLLLDYDNGVAHVEAIVYTSITHTILKYLVQRRRPDRPQRESFPSGHASNIFAAATSLSYAYGWWVGVPSFFLAGVVGAARLSDNVHFFSDVLAGATIGIFWGHATRRSKDSSVKPYFDLSRGVIGWEWNY